MNTPQTVPCPKCGRQVRVQPLCMYCGAKISGAPVAILGMNGPQWIGEGKRVLAMAQRERAETAFRNALKIDAKLDEAWLLLAATLAQLKRHEEARGAIEQGFAANPGSVLLREALEVADAARATGDPIMAARRLADTGNHAAAITALDQVLANPAFRAQPVSSVVLVQRGCSKKALGRLDDALADFTAATRADPSYALAHYDRADVLDDLGRHADALQAIEAALAVDPSYADAWSNRGYLLRKLGRDEDAIAAYDRALSLDDRNTNTWFNRGNLLAHRGESGAARTCFERVLGLQPDHSQATRAIAALDSRPTTGSSAPGRPVLEMLAEGDHGAVFSLLAVRRLIEGGVIPGSEAIAAMGARLELPPVTATLWGATAFVDTGVPFECLLKDGQALAIRSAGGRTALDESVVSPEEVRAWGALLQIRGVSRVLLVSDAALGEALARAVADVNKRLGAPAGQPPLQVVRVAAASPRPA